MIAILNHSMNFIRSLILFSLLTGLVLPATIHADRPITTDANSVTIENMFPGSDDWQIIWCI